MRYELRITGLDDIEPWPDPVEGTPREIAMQSISGLLDTPEVMAVPDSAAVVLVRRIKRGKRVRRVVKGRWALGDFRAQAAPVKVRSGPDDDAKRALAVSSDTDRHHLSGGEL